MHRQARNRREFFLSEARGHAKSLELRAKGPGCACFHWTLSSYCRCTGVVRVLCGNCRWFPSWPPSRLAGMAVEGEAARLVTGTPVSFICTTKHVFERHMNNSFCPQSTTPATGESFDEVVLPHLDAAFRLARWQMRNEHDAEDVVQEASLRALRYFRTFSGGNGRAWFLRIVRNTCWSWRDH